MRIPDRALVPSDENNGEECQRHPCRFVGVLLRSTGGPMRPKQISVSAEMLCAPNPHISFDSHQISHQMCSRQIFGGCKLLKRMAPQVGLEPTTLRLTVQSIVPAGSGWLRLFTNHRINIDDYQPAKAEGKQAECEYFDFPFRLLEHC
jgi:hypothetical protein